MSHFHEPASFTDARTALAQTPEQTSEQPPLLRIGDGALSDVEALSREELIGLCRAQHQLILELQAQVDRLTKNIADLERRIEQLQSVKDDDRPPFVKPNSPRKEKKTPRKKRSRSYHRLRSSNPPTQIVEHAADQCPDCGRKLTGGWLHRSRQVIEIPEPPPLQIIEHRIMARWCGVCHKRVLPTTTAPAEQVFGQVFGVAGGCGTHRRIGIRLMSWIGVLHIVARVPLRRVQHLLELLFGVHLGLGELSELLHAMAGKGKALREKLLEQVRGSPFVHADETGWREEGQNGYLWSFSTPSVRCFLYNKSRAGEVAEEALGKHFGAAPPHANRPEQVLVSDFYSGYHRFTGRKQRCWVHLLRDLKKLMEAHPQDTVLAEWVSQVRKLYDDAVAYQQHCRQTGEVFDCTLFNRRRKRVELEEALHQVVSPYLTPLPSRRPENWSPHLQTTLADRMFKHLGEMFTFVELPAVPADNNAAERSLRPAVIARKISGGTRSPKGSQTKTTLMSLFGTWAAQGRDPLRELRDMLAAA